MDPRYPEIEPYATGTLDVGDGNRLYWEVCGNPDGKPAVVLHGGPGSGCTPGVRRFFDPAAYRIVLFDQRGCGRSTPSAGDPGTDLTTNTTVHLIADLEALREHLDVEQWLVFGGSWGCTLGLAYAQTHPERVTEMVLMAITNTSADEIGWITRGIRRLLPAEWQRFSEGVPEADRDGNLPAAYARLLADPDAAVREQAARDWCAWEDVVASGLGSFHPDPRYDDPTFRKTFARLVTHYWSHAAWMDQGALVRGAAGMAGIPGVMVHGGADIGAPLVTAWEMARAWPGSELVVIGGAGHTTADPGMPEALIAATDRFAR